MRRIYQSRAYGDAPIRGNFWPTSVDLKTAFPAAQGELSCEVAIVGAGFTGLNAAHELAQAGVDVAVFEAKDVGFGASGRNGGFCCLGGEKLDQKAMIRRFGADETAMFRRAQRAAVDHVAAFLDSHEIDADVHSQGETLLAHRAKDIAALKEEAEDIRTLYGVEPELIDKSDLGAHGLSSPSFHGAVTTPIGFALNPMKYVQGLATVASAAGARIYTQSPVRSVEHQGRWTLITPNARIRAKKLLIATNGYGSEDIPGWLADRYMPAQSAVLVTRPLTDEEIAAQGYSSSQMCYDTRRLLHYFRLMPDNRFLFGMRGATSGSALASRLFRRKIRADFEVMFPAWAQVETPHFWSGFVCLTHRLTPFVGAMDPLPDAWAAYGFHGNGVAMGSYAGRLAAEDILSQKSRPRPGFLSQVPRRYGLGRLRRHALGPAYLAYGVMDR